MRRYRRLEVSLRNVRGALASILAEEDEIINAMADLWWELSEAERDLLDTEGPTCFTSAEAK